MKKILISDPVDRKCEEILKKAGYEVDYKTGLSTDELSEIIQGYDALVVRSETKVTPELISNMENMEVIGRAGTGVDNINLDAATRKGIIVMNTPGGNTVWACTMGEICFHKPCIFCCLENNFANALTDIEAIIGPALLHAMISFSVWLSRS